MKLFLKLKAWQMFLLITVPLCLPMFVAPDPRQFAAFASAFGFISWLWMLILVGWLYSVGTASNLRLPPSLQKNPLMYRLGFAFAVVFAAVEFGFIMPHITADIMTGIRSNTVPQAPPAYLAWVFPLHLLAMVAMFYGLWFTAKQFATLQRQEELSFFDYSGPFFMFWFAPIGVWFLQPKINALLGSDEEA